MCEGHKTGTCAVGSHPAGRSLHGLMDMAGNVSEWTDTDVSTSSGTDPAKVYRGGDFLDAAPRLTVSVRYWDSLTHQAPTRGFRCAQ